MPGLQDADDSDASPTWKWEADVTMHPFWAVRRLDAEQLTNENDKERAAAEKKGKSAVAATYNCSLVTRQFTVCNVGVFQGDSASFNLSVAVPLMTNFKKIAAGEELLLECE